MSTDFETKVRGALDRGRPLLEAVIADLEREAALIRERDLDPRKLADEPKIQEARSSAVEALEHLTEFAKSLDGLVKNYASELDKRVDVHAIKEQIAAAPAARRHLIDSSNGHGVTDPIRSTGDDAKERIETATQASKEQVGAAAQQNKEQVEAAAQRSKEHVEAAAQKGKDSTAEMLAALGWAAAAAAVIYMVFMDEKRREQAKKAAKVAGSGLMVAVNSASRKS